MKLHSIRFANINCLAGEWRIDFDDPGLSGGLFVLSGPTGAGKSSVLDAITLALFGRTARQGDDIGSGGNEVMTRGASHCFSEAEFTGADGERWIASWSQKCGSHEDGTPRLESPDIRLRPAGSGRDPTPHKGKEAARDIVGKVGLGFEEFVRTVVLEQGQFDKFLHAAEKDRAAILEKATDTRKFSERGARINERAKRENREAENLETAAATLKGAVENAGDPAELEARAEAHDAAAENAKTLADALRREAAWLAEEAAVAAEDGAIGKDAAALDGRRAGYAAAVAAIRASDKARALLSDRAAADAKENAAKKAAGDLARLEGISARLAAAVPNLVRKEAAAKEDDAAAQQALADAAQPLADARRLDGAIALARQAAGTAAAEVARLRTAHGGAAKSTAKARTDAADAVRAVGAAEGRVAAAKTKTDALGALRSASAAADKEQAAAERTAAEARRTFDDKTRPEAEKRLESLRGKQLLAAAVKGLEAHRRDLRPGKPCPLCGATEHPYADGLPEGLPTPDDVKKELDGEKKALDAAEKAVVALEAAAADARKKAEGARQTLQAAETTALAATAKADADLQVAKACAQTLANAVPVAEKAEADAKAALDRATDEETAAKADLNGRIVERARIPFPDANAHEKGLRDRATQAGRDAAAAATALVQARTQAANAADNVRTAKDALTAANAARDEALAAFAARLAQDGFADEKAWRDACLSDAGRTAAETTRKNFVRDESTLDGRRQALAARKTKHGASPDRPAEIRDAGTVAAALAAAEKTRNDETSAAATLRADIQAQGKARKDYENAERKAAERRARSDKWQRLDRILGGPNGKAFLLYAQGRNLRALLDAASPRLEAMSGGDYRFEWNPATGSLEPFVRDRHFEDPRPVSNLSGGESFMASLALALSFANFNARRAPIGTLFLDEGFGTLDADALDRALDTLDSLRGDANRQVGLVTHVAQVKERIPAHIDVAKIGDGRSRLSGPGVTELGDGSRPRRGAARAEPAS